MVNSIGTLKLLLAFCVGLVVAIFAQRFFTNASSRANSITATKQTTNATPDKPWGNLEITSVPFEDNEEIFLDRAARLKKAEWVFEGGTAEQVVTFLQSTDLNDTQKRALLATNAWTIHGSNCTIHPSDEIVAGLSQKAREKIYWALGQCQSNYAQCFPFRFAPKRFEERFANSGMSKISLGFIRSLCYTNDGLLSFCDLDVASKNLNAPAFNSLIRVLYAMPTVRLRLHVGPNDDVEKLAKYWGKGGREKRVRPLLESIARLPGGDSVSVAYLLPGAARLRLYTFPDTTRDPVEAREDCFFTALNFFNKYADEKFLDKTNTRQALQNDYTLVTDKPTFGDLITLINGQGDAVHIAVYIADDIVFTKNGVNLLQPWVLMRMDDMLSYFPSPEPVRIAIFRKKEFAQTATAAR